MLDAIEPVASSAIANAGAAPTRGRRDPPILAGAGGVEDSVRTTTLLGSLVLGTPVPEPLLPEAPLPELLIPEPPPSNPPNLLAILSPQ
jgi:hypothetical protein